MSFTSDIAFTPTVKAVQARKGSRRGYEKMEAGGSWQARLPADLKAFIETRNSAFLGTVNADGQPYIQHRGGPAGFLRVVDDRTIGFVDFSGNRQYISTGNLTDNPKAFLFLMDYTHRLRLKLWGTARVVENDPALIETLMPPDYGARPEQAMLFTVDAWDLNCPQHIPQMFGAEDVAEALAGRDRRIAELQEELAALRSKAALPD